MRIILCIQRTFSQFTEIYTNKTTIAANIYVNYVCCTFSCATLYTIKMCHSNNPKTITCNYLLYTKISPFVLTNTSPISKHGIISINTFQFHMLQLDSYLHTNKQNSKAIDNCSPNTALVKIMLIQYQYLGVLLGSTAYSAGCELLLQKLSRSVVWSVDLCAVSCIKTTELIEMPFGVKTGVAQHTHARTHTHAHPFNGPLSRTTRVSQYQKGTTYLDFTEARDSEWQWHQLGHMQVCTLLQTDNHASTPPLSFLQAGYPSCSPTNSVKALKALYKICGFIG